MTLSHQNARDLDLFFQRVGHFQRSISGPMYEKMFLFAVDKKELDRERVLTARPTAEIRAEPSTSPAVEEIEFLGKVNNRLGRCMRKHRVALELFWGDEGACCAERLRKYGRIVSLFALTQAGKKLLRRESDMVPDSQVLVTPSQIIQNAVSRQELQGAVDLLIATATRQALEIKEAAENAYTEADAWFNTQRPQPMPRAFVRLVEADE